MRARRGTILGWLAVVAYAALLAAVALTTSHERRLAGGERDGAAAAEDLVEAWGRSRRATFVTVGTFERRSEITGAAISSEDVVAQRPPDRLHRQLGGVEGRRDDRLLVCPAPPPDADPEPCRLGAPGSTYEASVERELAGLRSVVMGADPLYDVTVGTDGCFVLDLRRPDPRATFGLGATLCFDDETGAPIRREVRHEGGITEVLAVDEVHRTVTDEDLEP